MIRSKGRVAWSYGRQRQHQNQPLSTKGKATAKPSLPRPWTGLAKTVDNAVVVIDEMTKLEPNQSFLSFFLCTLDQDCRSLHAPLDSHSSSNGLVGMTMLVGVT